jgi:hypothetical protein
LFGLSVLAQGRVEAGYTLTANAAGSQSSTLAGVTTETFNSFGAGNYTSLNTAVGTVTSPGLQIIPADQFGGAGGMGLYFAVGAQSGQLSATLALKGPQSYFGFWWSAADSENEIAFYSNGVKVADFTTAQAFAGLGSAYNGNPSNGLDSGEKFAYFNFVGTGGSTFNQVVFSNLSTATGFEIDNWSVASVPEPSSLALTAMGFLALLGVARRRRTS